MAKKKNSLVDHLLDRYVGASGAQGTFPAFELVAIGRRWGRTQMNGRGKDDFPGLVGFHLERAPSAPHIAPTFVVAYGVDWIVPPGIPAWIESPAECGLEED